MKTACLRAGVLALATSLTAASLSSQQEIIVDASGVQGFLSLQEGIDRAAPGQVVRVLPGAYAGALITKSVRVLTKGARLRSPMIIRDLAPQDLVVVTGLDAGLTDQGPRGNAFLPQPWGVIRDCQGMVALADFDAGAIEVERSRSVIIDRFYGGPLRVEDSRIDLVDSIVGRHPRDTPWADWQPQPSLVLRGSDALLSGSAVYTFSPTGGSEPAARVEGGSKLTRAGSIYFGFPSVDVDRESSEEDLDLGFFYPSVISSGRVLELELKLPWSQVYGIAAGPAAPRTPTRAGDLALDPERSFVVELRPTRGAFVTVPAEVPPGPYGFPRAKQDLAGVPLVIQAAVLVEGFPRLLTPFVKVF